MNNKPVISDISLSLFAEKDRSETINLLTEAFCVNDPIESALQITPAEFKVMVELELEPILKDELSLVAYQIDTGRLCGAIIAVDALSEPIESGVVASEKFEPISEIARNLHEFYITTRSVQEKSCLYIFMVGVLPELAGKGVGKMLIGETLRNAKDKGYQSAFTMTTNLASTAAFATHRFKAIKTIDYQTYMYRNQLVFSSINLHPGIVLMELECL